MKRGLGEKIGTRAIASRDELPGLAGAGRLKRAPSRPKFGAERNLIASTQT